MELKSVSRDASQRINASFYNGSNNGLKNVTVKTILDMGKEIWNECPFENILWYPHCRITTCYYNYFFQMILYQLIPALFIDGILILMGKRPM